jgi:ABC-type glycerol-3-phosphate transport system permease component
VWNEFIIALNLTASHSRPPLTVGLYFFVGETGIQWGNMAAAIEGLTAGAPKG